MHDDRDWIYGKKEGADPEETKETKETKGKIPLRLHNALASRKVARGFSISRQITEAVELYLEVVAGLDNPDASEEPFKIIEEDLPTRNLEILTFFEDGEPHRIRDVVRAVPAAAVGLVSMYIYRTADKGWIERADAGIWRITPEGKRALNEARASRSNTS